MAVVLMKNLQCLMIDVIGEDIMKKCLVYSHYGKGRSDTLFFVSDKLMWVAARDAVASKSSERKTYKSCEFHFLQ